MQRTARTRAVRYGDTGMNRTSIAVGVIIAAAAAVFVAMVMIPGTTDITVYTDEGISANVSGGMMGTTTLKADVDEGTEFDGWYDEEGFLISKSTEYTAFFDKGDVVYAFAKSYLAADLDTETDLTLLMSVSGEGTFTVGRSDYDGSSPMTDGTVTVFASPGVYVITYVSEDVHRCSKVFVDGEIDIEYEWSYNTTTEPIFSFFRKWFKSSSGQNFELELSILYSDYLHYTEIYDDDERICYYSNRDGSDKDIAHDLSFVRYDNVQDKYIKQIADYISSKTAGKDEQYVANVILSFVQTIPYAYDSDVHGNEEYWQFPLETLFLSSGDCEDSSILFCAIASYMGYDAALFLFEDHMGAGVYLEDFKASRTYSSSVQSDVVGWKITVGEGEDAVKVPYYYGETTSIGWLIGEVPADEYDKFERGFAVPNA